jgi:hypothetical protein
VDVKAAMEQVASQAPSDNEAAQSGGNDIDVESTGLCERCTRSDFGERVPEKDSPASDHFSRRSLKLQHLQPNNCDLSGSIPSWWSQNFYRYIPLGTTNHTHKGNALNSLDPYIDQLFHFKLDVDGGSSPSQCLSTAIHSFTPISTTQYPFAMKSADLLLAKEWYQHCYAHHKEACGSKSEDQVPFFKVINCLNGHICEIPVGEKYIALSYVWGVSAAK